jgi:MFS family permease
VPSDAPSQDPFRHRNVRLYSWFTVFYSARAYYPVFTILFLDLGVTLAQFVLLNMIWATVIVLLEVPSGAMADTIGRRKLVVFASALMVAEMAMLLFAPKDGGWILLAMCFTNRVLSGASEAAASGADQALAFDSLVEHGEEDQWDEVLARVMRRRSVGFFIAMTIGALVYDAKFLEWLFSTDLDATLVHRLPVALVFAQSIACLAVALRMREPKREAAPGATTAELCASATRLTLRAAAWVLKTPLAFRIVLGGLLIDSVVRNLVVVNSEYYRLIALPPVSFGFIGSAVAVIGFFVPAFAKRMTDRFSPMANLAFMGVMVLLCLVLITPAFTYWGVLPFMLLFTSFGWLEYLSSRTLNRLATSDQRATVLSVKSLAFNLGYAAASLAYARLVAWEEGRHDTGGDAFISSLGWLPLYFVAALGLFFLFVFATRKHSRDGESP